MISELNNNPEKTIAMIIPAAVMICPVLYNPFYYGSFVCVKENMLGGLIHMF